MIKLEFPANRLDVAAVFGRALIDYAQGTGELENGLDRSKFIRQGVPDSNDLGAEKPSIAELTASEAEIAARLADNEMGKSASTATAPDGTTGDATHGSGDASATVDVNGLEFNGLYCGVAKEPFYGTGPRKGQWKKLRGIDDDTYDRWYSETKAKTSPGAGSATTPDSSTATQTSDRASVDSNDQEPANTAAAFGNTQAAATAEPVPSTPGEFMGWTAERQAAGLLTQGDIESVYHENGLGVTDLFGAHAPEVIAGHIATLHGHMSALIASRGNA